MLHALEALRRRLAEVGRSAGAVEAVVVAVSAKPLRENAQPPRADYFRSVP
jgi:hypothetical protein